MSSTSVAGDIETRSPVSIIPSLRSRYRPAAARPARSGNRSGKSLADRTDCPKPSLNTSRIRPCRAGGADASGTSSKFCRKAYLSGSAAGTSANARMTSNCSDAPRSRKYLRRGPGSCAADASDMAAGTVLEGALRSTGLRSVATGEYFGCPGEYDGSTWIGLPVSGAALVR